MSRCSGVGGKGVTARGILGAVTVGAVTAVSLLPATIPDYVDESGTRIPGSIAEMVSVELGGVDQWLVIRGRDTTNPVLLFLHGGPGTPETVFLEEFNRDLADDFVVVSWEQRGAGKSFSPRPPTDSMTEGQLVADTNQLARYLKHRFGQERIYLVGHSWGTVLAIRAAARNPDDYHAVVSVSQTSDAIREQQLIYRWVRDRAAQDGNNKALRQIEPIGDRVDEALPLEDTSVLLSWVDHYGGGAFQGRKSFPTLAWIVAKSRVYTTREKIDYLRGERFSLEQLYPEVSQLDLFTEIHEVEVPIYFLHGRHDYQVPMAVAYDFYLHLQAPFKRFVVFDDAAHGVIYEDPAGFRRVMAEVASKAIRAKVWPR